jgi:hypothetical protein
MPRHPGKAQDPVARVTLETLTESIVLKRTPDGRHAAFHTNNPEVELPGIGMAFHHSYTSHLYIPPAWLEQTTLPARLMVLLPSASETAWFVKGPGQHADWAGACKDGEVPPVGVGLQIPSLLSLITGRKYKSIEKIIGRDSSHMLTIAQLDHRYGDGRIGRKYGINPEEQEKNGWFFVTTRKDNQTYPGWDALEALRNPRITAENWKQTIQYADNHAAPEPREAFFETVQRLLPKGPQTKIHDTPQITYPMRAKIAWIITLFRNKEAGHQQGPTKLRDLLPQWLRIQLLEDFSMMRLVNKNDNGAGTFHICEEAVIATCYDGEFHAKILRDTKSGGNEALVDTIQQTLHNKDCLFPREEAQIVWNDLSVPAEFPAFGGYLFGFTNGLSADKEFLQQTAPGTTPLVTNPKRFQQIITLLLEHKKTASIPAHFEQRAFDPAMLPKALAMLKKKKTPEAEEAFQTLINLII